MGTRNWLRVGLFAATTLALGGPAFAQANPNGGRDRGHDQTKLLERFDTNKNGRIDADEWEARRSQHKAEMLKKFDTNKNGTLEDGEKTAAKAARKAKHAVKMKERFTSMDKNRDGKLVAAEVEGRLAKRFAQIDANQDGAITWAELEAAPKGHKGGKHGWHGGGDCGAGRGKGPGAKV